MQSDAKPAPTAAQSSWAQANTIKPRRKPLNTAGRPTATELARRKDVVMEVATELFVHHGYAATSLVDIARGAGVATRTLYQHFGDKEAIFREVIFARDTGAIVETPTVRPDDSLFLALHRAGKYAYAVAYRAQSIGLMRLMISESRRFPDFMASVAASIFGRFRRNFEKVFVALEAAELIPPGDHGRSAELFCDLMLGNNPIMAYTTWSTVTPSEQDMEERIELFILGRFGSAVARRARTRKARLHVAA